MVGSPRSRCGISGRPLRQIQRQPVQRQPRLGKGLLVGDEENQSSTNGISCGLAAEYVSASRVHPGRYCARPTPLIARQPTSFLGMESRAVRHHPGVGFRSKSAIYPENTHDSIMATKTAFSDGMTRYSERTTRGALTRAIPRREKANQKVFEVSAGRLAETREREVESSAPHASPP